MSKRVERLVVVAFVVLGLWARLLWPGDAPFINDEPKFLDFGLRFSQTLDPLILGLKGHLGVHYGPYTSWFFGALFFITHDLTLMVLLKSLLVSSLTLLSLFWLAKNLTFARPLYVLPVVLSLYLYIDARLLWDLNILNCIVAFAAYVSFIKHERFSSLLLAVVTLAFATLTHLMCMPLVLAIVMHFAGFKLAWIKKHVPHLLILLAVLLAVAGPYYLHVIETPRVAANVNLHLRSLGYSLLGARLFTTYDFSYFVGDRWQTIGGLPGVLNHLFTALAAITWLAYPVFWLGLFRAGRALWKEGWLAMPKRAELSTEEQVLSIAMATVVLHTMFSLLSGPREHPHYYNGVWPVMLMLFWYGLDGLLEKRWGRPVYFAYVASLSFFLCKVVIDLHLNHGTRTLHYGPTLTNQIDIVREVRKIKNAEVIELEAMHPRMFPHAFSFIAQLEPKSESDGTVQVVRARVQYASQDPNNGRIELAVQR